MRLTSSVRLHSPTLVRELAALDVAEVPADRATLAERLGGWLGWTDAIALAGVLDAPAPARTGRAPAFDPAAAVAQANATLAAAIDAMAPLDEDDADGQRRHRQQQQAFDAALGPLRARLRTALASRSAEGARLAAVDAVLEQALAPHWREALAGGPGWLKRHRRQHGGQALPALQRLLHAELDLRLQPLHGLAEALR